MDLWGALRGRDVRDVADAVQADDDLAWAFEQAVSAASTPGLLAAAELLGFGGDDGSSDFRVWLVLQGREVYDAALASPDTLAGVEVDGDAVSAAGEVGTWTGDAPKEWSASKKRKNLPRLFELTRRDWSEKEVRGLVGKDRLESLVSGLCAAILGRGTQCYEGLFTVSAAKSPWGVWVLEVVHDAALTEALAKRQIPDGDTPAHHLVAALLQAAYPRARSGGTLTFELGDPGAIECTCRDGRLQLRMRLGGTLLRQLKRSRVG